MKKLLLKLHVLKYCSPSGRKSLRVGRIARNIAEAPTILKELRGDLPEEEQKRLLERISYYANERWYSAAEYLLFNPDERTEEERDEFVSDLEHVVFVDKLNRLSNKPKINVKVNFAEIFKKYYKRDYCAVYSQRDRNKLIKFLNKHGRAIVKLQFSSCGRGAYIVDVANDSAEKIADEIISQNCRSRYGCVIVDELIQQDERMSRLHPQSINTLRIATVRLNDRTVIFHIPTCASVPATASSTIRRAAESYAFSTKRVKWW